MYLHIYGCVYTKGVAHVSIYLYTYASMYLGANILAIQKIHTSIRRSLKKK